jgi:group I intron endonuclease
MYGKKHTEATKLLISKIMKKYPFGVGLYDLNNYLIKKYNNNAAMARDLNISKTTVGKYIITGKIFNNLYYFKINKS